MGTARGLLVVALVCGAPAGPPGGAASREGIKGASPAFGRARPGAQPAVHPAPRRLAPSPVGAPRDHHGGAARVTIAAPRAARLHAPAQVRASLAGELRGVDPHGVEPLVELPHRAAERGDGGTEGGSSAARTGHDPHCTP